MSDLYVEIGDQKFEITINSKTEIVINKKKYLVEMTQIDSYLYQLNIDGKLHQIFVSESEKGKFNAIIEGEIYNLQLQTTLENKAKKFLKKNSNNNSNKNIVAPMNGLIVKINKRIGEAVKIGDSLIILEAMKMENEIKATSEGTIKIIKGHIGKSVDKGELLFIIT